MLCKSKQQKYRIKISKIKFLSEHLNALPQMVHNITPQSIPCKKDSTRYVFYEEIY